MLMLIYHGLVNTNQAYQNFNTSHVNVNHKDHIHVYLEFDFNTSHVNVNRKWQQRCFICCF